MVDAQKEKMSKYHAGISFIYKRSNKNLKKYNELMKNINTLSTDDLNNLLIYINDVNNDIKNQNIKDLDNYLKINNDIIEMITTVLNNKKEIDDMDKTSVNNIMDCYSKLDFLYTTYKDTELFSEEDLIVLLNVFNKEELEMFKIYINNINYDLYYDYEKGIKLDYDEIEAKNNYFIELINKLLNNRKRD